MDFFAAYDPRAVEAIPRRCFLALADVALAAPAPVILGGAEGSWTGRTYAGTPALLPPARASELPASGYGLRATPETAPVVGCDAEARPGLAGAIVQR